jgi:UMF1 family MFS transporter
MAAPAVFVPLHELSEEEYKRRIRAWTLYDWANSAFATTVLAAVLPFYYSQVAGSTLPSAAKATQYWSLTLSVTVFIVAIISPILGTVSDIMRGKKKFLSVFVTIGVIGTGLLIMIDTGDWLLASIFFAFGRIGFAAANVFYDALLPHVAREEDQDRVSTQGYAIGYLGGGLLLAINLVMIQLLPDGNWGVRLSMLSVAVWWALFSIPLFRRVPEPPSASKKLEPGETLLGVSFGRIVKTLREIRQYRELFKYLVSFLIYNDGIGIIIAIAAIYVAELGFGLLESVLAILLVQFVGIPYSLIFGNLPSKSNKRQTMYVAFVLFNIVALPIAGISGRFGLPQTLTGTPSPSFTDTETAVGEGIYQADALTPGLIGSWTSSIVSAEIRGVEEDAVYAQTAGAGDRIDFNFNGQQVELTHSIGPDHGTWAVEIDGAPYVEDGQPVIIDARSDTLRYDETVTFTAETEGQHTLSLINVEDAVISIAQIEVKPPLRTSNLGAIIGFLLAVQLVAAVFALLLGPVLFKGIADRLDTKRSIIIALIAYAIIAIWGFFLNSVIEFWFLAWMVAIVQGGSQALSRSLYAAMSPTALSGEFFGLFSIMSKFASLLSPLVFALAVGYFGSSRPGILSIIIFFLVGMALLSRVNVDEGKRVAKEKDTELLATAS